MKRNFLLGLVVFDKKTGITYFTNKKEYLDTKGDLYLYE